MVNITYLGCSGFCPHIQETVTLSGKYSFVENSEMRKLRFLTFTCPIAENAKLHYYEQCEKYKYLKPCENSYNCPIAKNFKEIVTL